MLVTGLLDHRSYFSIYNWVDSGAFRKEFLAPATPPPRRLWWKFGWFTPRNTSGGSGGFLILYPRNSFRGLRRR